MRPGRSRAMAATALALGALLTTALPATAAEGAGPASRCTPAVHVLDRLPGTGVASWGSESVNDFGTGSLSVGRSAGLPVYWTGSAVHRVPLPSGYDSGSVAAVNHRGLMVGSIQGPVGVAAFSYRAGASAVRILPGGTYAADVNDLGTVAGGNDNSDTAYLWTGATLTRTLTVKPGHTRVRVRGINSRGTVIGYSWYWDGVSDMSGSVGLVWPGGTTGPGRDLKPVEINTDTDWYPSAIDNHGRVVGERTYDHQDLAAETYWDAPYTKDGVQIPGLPVHEGKGWLNDISPSSGVAVGTAMFPYGIPPMTPIDQAQIWPGSGPIRALPSLAPDGPAGAEAVNDKARVGGWAYDGDPYDGAGAPHPVIWTCALG